MLRTCDKSGDEGTRMYPRGATAHGRSFAPVTTLAMHPGAQVLSISYERRTAYLPQADTSRRQSKLCKDSSFQTNCLCKRCNESHSNVLKIRLCMPRDCAGARSAGAPTSSGKVKGDMLCTPPFLNHAVSQFPAQFKSRCIN